MGDNDPTNADAEINIADDMRFQEIGQEIDKLKWSTESVSDAEMDIKNGRREKYYWCRHIKKMERLVN